MTTGKEIQTCSQITFLSLGLGVSFTETGKPSLDLVGSAWEDDPAVGGCMATMCCGHIGCCWIRVACELGIDWVAMVEHQILVINIGMHLEHNSH